MPYLTAKLFQRCGQTLGATQADLGKSLGVSRRTAQRWARHGGVVVDQGMIELARRVHPRDARLAEEVAATLGNTLLGLGIVRPPPPPLPPPAPPPPPPPIEVVDAVVCAAAEAMEMTPRAVRRGLYAAFSRAQELGLSLDLVVRALGSKLPPAEPGPSPSP